MLAWLTILLGVGAVSLPCTVDPALRKAAEQLLQLDSTPTIDDLALALRGAGSDLPGTKALRFRTNDPETLKNWLEELQQEKDAPMVCAMASNKLHSLVVAAFRAGSLQRLPGGTKLRVRLAEGFTNPRLVLRLRSGKLEAKRPTPDELRDGIDLSKLPEPALRAQLLAAGPRGMRPVAELELEAAAPSSAKLPTVPPMANVPPLPSEATKLDVRQGVRLRDEVDRWRRQRRARPLHRQRLMRSLAEDRARLLCSGPPASPDKAAASEEETKLRLQRVGLDSKAAGEAAARGGSFAAALEQLRSNAAHQRLLSDPRFASAGFASASNQAGECCLVVILGAAP